jgi:hypothetical protein
LAIAVDNLADADSLTEEAEKELKEKEEEEAAKLAEEEAKVCHMTSA